MTSSCIGSKVTPSIALFAIWTDQLIWPFPELIYPFSVKGNGWETQAKAYLDAGNGNADATDEDTG